jgi:hypothetical protein
MGTLCGYRNLVRLHGTTANPHRQLERSLALGRFTTMGLFVASENDEKGVGNDNDDIGHRHEDDESVSNRPTASAPPRRPDEHPGARNRRYLQLWRGTA